MKNLLNKYFDFIGVKNEGLRRIILLLIIYLNFPLYKYLDNKYWRYYWDWEWVMLSIPISIFSVGIIVKIFNWVKDGFSE